MSYAGRKVELSRGAVWIILRNPVYYGDVVYLGVRYAGKHTAIIEK